MQGNFHITKRICVFIDDTRDSDEQRLSVVAQAIYPEQTKQSIYCRRFGLPQLHAPLKRPDAFRSASATATTVKVNAIYLDPPRIAIAAIRPNMLRDDT